MNQKPVILVSGLVRVLFIPLLAFPVSWSSAKADSSGCLITWQPIQQVSRSAYSSFGARLVVSGDTAHLVYLSLGIQYQRSTDGGGTWTPALTLVPDDSTPASLFNRPLSGSGEHLYLAWESRTDAGIYFKSSSDAGRTWSPDTLLFPSVWGVGRFLGPTVASRGSWVFVVGTRCWFNCRNVIRRSSDYGATWDSIRELPNPPQQHVVEDMVAVDSSVHIVTRRFGTVTEEVGYLGSSDRGLTWSPEIYLSSVDSWYTQGRSIAAAPGGEVAVCWVDRKYGQWTGYSGSLLVRLSTDGGTSWSQETMVSTIPSAVGSAVSFGDNRLSFVWDDERSRGASRRVFFRRWVPGGTAWCPETELSAGDTISTASLNPSVAVGNGTVYVAFSVRPPSPDQIYLRRGSIVTSIEEPGDATSAPETAVLYPPYPNPFNSTTSLTYELSRAGLARLTLRDILGRTVVSISEIQRTPGRYQTTLHADGLASGVYFVVFEAGQEFLVRPVILTR